MADHGPRIHLTISSHAYGVLTQAIALARELIKQVPDSIFRIQCNLPGKVISERLGNDDFEHDKCSMDIGLIQKDPITPDLHPTYSVYIANQLENAGSNTWKLSLIRESNDFPRLGKISSKNSLIFCRNSLAL